jgi:hypothetical protein
LLYRGVKFDLFMLREEQNWQPFGNIEYF